MSVEVTLGLRPEHRELLQRLLQDHPAFDDAEVQVALELVDAALAHRSRGDAARSDAATSTSVRPSISPRERKKTSLPSRNSAAEGDDGGVPSRCARTRAVA